jgi:dTDP-glucose pyrophosphorylase
MAPLAGRPEAGVKKVNAMKQASSSATSGIDASISEMVESITKSSKDSHEISDARWKAMYETQQEKLNLEREKVAAAKLDAKATMIKAMNESSNVALAKMKEDTKILQEDMYTMGSVGKSTVHDVP